MIQFQENTQTDKMEGPYFIGYSRGSNKNELNELLRNQK